MSKLATAMANSDPSRKSPTPDLTRYEIVEDMRVGRANEAFDCGRVVRYSTSAGRALRSLLAAGRRRIN